MDDQYGYDADFVEDVPDRLKCVVCHLVMRHPVQIMTCGHRFCKICFQRIEGYAVHLNTRLLCPLDRDVIDINKVFADTAVSREISNLDVKCPSSSKGCTWIGRLGSYQNHSDTCNFNLDQLVAQKDNGFTMKTIDDVTSRLYKLEELFSMKEKEISFLSDDMLQLNSKCKKQEQEIRDLRKDNDDLRLGMTKLTDSITKVEHQNVIIQEKHNTIEVKLGKIDKDMATLKNNNPVPSGQLKNVDEELKNMSIQLRKKVNENTHRNRIESLSTEYNELKKHYKGLEELAENNDKKYEKLKEHIVNLENLHFCEKSNEILIKWKVTNFQSRLAYGVKVSSPIFFTSLKGFAFQLWIKWTDKKDFMGLGIKVHRSELCNQQLKEFDIPFNLEMVDNDGSIKSNRVTQSNINADRDVFTITAGCDSNVNMYGWIHFLNMVDIDKYMSSDTITVQCRFLLQ